MSVLKELKSRVKGRHVLLVGSAPSVVYNPDHNKVLVCVNGSALGIGSPKADITFLNTSLYHLGDDSNRVVRIKTDLSSLRAGWVMLIDAAELGPITTFKSVEGMTYMDRAGRRELIEKITGWRLTGDSGNHVPSTGYTAALLLVCAGCETLEMQGFSFEGGHSYLKESTKREHIEMDRRVAAILDGCAAQALNPAKEKIYAR